MHTLRTHSRFSVMMSPWSATKKEEQKKKGRNIFPLLYPLSLWIESNQIYDDDDGGCGDIHIITRESTFRPKRVTTTSSSSIDYLDCLFFTRFYY